jgi:hypothetical protein
MDPPSSLAPTNGSINHQEPDPTSAFNPEIFRSYLLSLLPPVIGAYLSDLESLFDEEFDARVARFASDTGGVIYVVKVNEESEGTSLYFTSIPNQSDILSKMIPLPHFHITLPRTLPINLHM